MSMRRCSSPLGDGRGWRLIAVVVQGLATWALDGEPDVFGFRQLAVASATTDFLHGKRSVLALVCSVRTVGAVAERSLRLREVIAAGVSAPAAVAPS